MFKKVKLKSRTPNPQHQGGFTLVEMSVVLVLAGLLFAAVTTAMELVSTAKAKKAVNDIILFESKLQLYAQVKGRFPGDCDADGVIDYAADITDRGDADNNNRAVLYAFSSALPTIPEDGGDATRQTDGCALTGAATDDGVSQVQKNEVNANVWINDLKLAGVISDSVPNRKLAKMVTEDFMFVGKVTDNGSESADGADYNAIVMHNVPQWMAMRMAQAINGQDSTATRSRLRSLRMVFKTPCSPQWSEGSRRGTMAS